MGTTPMFFEFMQQLVAALSKMGMVKPLSRRASLRKSAS